MNDETRNLLAHIVCEAFDANAITDQEHDDALFFLNGDI